VTILEKLRRTRQARRCAKAWIASLPVDTPATETAPSA
jgi:hypothetical protein